MWNNNRKLDGRSDAGLIEAGEPPVAVEWFQM
jgi:hypothetical protein